MPVHACVITIRVYYLTVVYTGNFNLASTNGRQVVNKNLGETDGYVAICPPNILIHHCLPFVFM